MIRASTVLQKTIDLTVAVSSDRIAGMKCKLIAERYGISVSMVRYYLRRAMKTGVASQEAINYKTPAPRPRKSAGEYNAEWVRRILDNIEISPTGCWLWKGQIGTWGYGQTSHRGRNVSVHRAMYEVLHGVKLDRWQLVTHTCDVTACTNPVHLVLGTPADNVLDAASKGRHHNARKTHCKRGHPLSGANLWVCSRGLRHCKTCANYHNRIRAGWSEEEALNAPVVPVGAPTKRRYVKRVKQVEPSCIPK